MRPLLGYLVDAGMVECSDFSISNPGARFTVGACSSDLSGWQSLEDAGSAEELNVSERIGVHGLSGKRETAWSFCRPDVGIVHVPAADMCGNARIIGALCGCPDIARAAARTIMSVDQILPQEHICGYAGLTEISSDDIDEVVEQPFGATPGACRGHYGFDIAHLLEFRTLCEEFRKSGNTDRLQKYYDRNIFGCETFEDFLNLQSSHSLQEIIRKDGGQSLDLD
ncbi:MAG: hypothetical protein P4L69_17630 [Desulfosporosinus sp.]|nr:hypothetical protein [Desulfosporosinus sp.]